MSLANDMPVRSRMRVSSDTTPDDSSPTSDGPGLSPIADAAAKIAAKYRHDSPVVTETIEGLDVEFRTVNDVRLLFPARRHDEETKELRAMYRSCLLLAGKPVDPPVERKIEQAPMLDGSELQVAKAAQELDKILVNVQVARNCLTHSLNHQHRRSSRK